MTQLSVSARAQSIGVRKLVAAVLGALDCSMVGMPTNELVLMLENSGAKRGSASRLLRELLAHGLINVRARQGSNDHYATIARKGLASVDRTLASERRIESMRRNYPKRNSEPCIILRTTAKR